MWDIVCFSPQGHKSVAAWFYFCSQAPQWPYVARKWLSKDNGCRGRSKPGFRIVGWSTRERLTTWADFHFEFSFRWLLTSTRIRSCHKGVLGERQACGGLMIAEWIGQLSLAIIFSTSPYVVIYAVTLHDKRSNLILIYYNHFYWLLVI